MAAAYILHQCEEFTVVKCIPADAIPTDVLRERGKDASGKRKCAFDKKTVDRRLDRRYHVNITPIQIRCFQWGTHRVGYVIIIHVCQN